MMHGLRLVTWNAAALFTATATSRSLARARLAMLKSLCMNNDIVMIQEAHGNQCHLQLLENELPEFLLMGTFCRNPAAGGAILAIRKALVNTVAPPQMFILDPGRCCAALLEHDGHKMLCANIHLMPSYTQEEKCALLRDVRALVSDIGALTVLAGDFNFVMVEEARYDEAMAANKTGDHAIASYFNNLLGDFCDLRQCEHTRRQVHDRKYSALSRIDRVYTNCAPHELFEMRPYAALTHKLLDPGLPSDHAPVRVVFMRPCRSPPAVPRVQGWVTAHPRFRDHTTAALRDLPVVDAGSPARVGIKDAIRTAAANVKDGTNDSDPVCTHQKLHVAMFLHRAGTSGDRRALSTERCAVSLRWGGMSLRTPARSMKPRSRSMSVSLR